MLSSYNWSSLSSNKSLNEGWEKRRMKQNPSGENGLIVANMYMYGLNIFTFNTRFEYLLSY